MAAILKTSGTNPDRLPDPAREPVEPVAMRPGLACSPGEAARPLERAVPTEVAIGLSFNGKPHTVLMATPSDVTDLALGFTVSEAIATFADVAEVTVTAETDGLLADVSLRTASRRPQARPRSLEGRSSCGLCGVQRLADALRPLPQVESPARFSVEAVQRAVDALGDFQVLGKLTRATHAAAFASEDGEILLVREDVGRHNALDKLGGALLQAGMDPPGGFLVVTSRCSFEMVEKTARFGAPMIVAISAPTDLAIRRAEAAGVTLVALARSDGHTVFSCPDRLGLAPPGARRT